MKSRLLLMGIVSPFVKDADDIAALLNYLKIENAEEQRIYPYCNDWLVIPEICLYFESK